MSIIEAPASFEMQQAFRGDAEIPTSYRVYFQDFRGFTPFIGQPKPAVQTFDFSTLEEARRFRADLPVDADCIATITPTPKEAKRLPARSSRRRA